MDTHRHAFRVISTALILAVALFGTLFYLDRADAVAVQTDLTGGGDLFLWRETGTNTMNLTVSPGVTCGVRDVLVHYNMPCNTATLTVSIDATGTAYDVVHKSVAVTGLTDFPRASDASWPINPIILGPDDSLRIIESVDTGTTWGVSVFWSPITKGGW